MYRRCWFLFLFVAAASAVAASGARETGLMLREGAWDGDVGSFDVPDSLSSVNPSNWPTDGWYRVTIHRTAIDSQSMSAHKGGMPAFLATIVLQVKYRQSNATAPMPTRQDTGPLVNRVYLRVPNVKLREGSISPYVFNNGTSTLRPKLDHLYELKLAEQSFSFRVQNGLRTKGGTAYGGGAQYTIEYDGNTYEYSLGEYGWDSTIQAIADLDLDGKPDFLISVGGNNSGYEAILLSSKARPGKNSATASLRSTGC